MWFQFSLAGILPKYQIRRDNVRAQQESSQAAWRFVTKNDWLYNKLKKVIKKIIKKIDKKTYKINKSNI